MPTANAGPDRNVIGGLIVPLDGSYSIGAQQWQWEQYDGDTVTLVDADQPTVRVVVPPDAADGAEFRFRLTVFRGDRSSTDEAMITVHDPEFQDFLGAIGDPAELGSSEGIAFAADRMWIVSFENFVSAFDPSGAFVQRWDIPGLPVGANFLPDGRLAVANANLERLDAIELAAGARTTITDGLEGGGALGPANYPLVDANGNVFLSTRTGQRVLRYDAAAQVTRIFLDGIGTNPNALAFGPEPDMLYVGTYEGVWRVPILPDGTAAAPVMYVSGLASEVDGLAFDIGYNLWVGCPNTATLYLVPWAASGESTPVRTFANIGGNISLFTSATFANDAFGATFLYWTNLSDRTVGRLDTGLPAL